VGAKRWSQKISLEAKLIQWGERNALIKKVIKEMRERESVKGQGTKTEKQLARKQRNESQQFLEGRLRVQECAKVKGGVMIILGERGGGGRGLQKEKKNTHREEKFWSGGDCKQCLRPFQRGRKPEIRGENLLTRQKGNQKSKK